MMIRWLAVLLIAGLAGCASKAPAPVAESQAPARIEAAKTAQASAPVGKVHVVKKGDTLFSIAREQGLNPRDIAAWNNLDNSDRISVGQQLRLAPPTVAPTASPTSSATADGPEVRPIAASGSVVARPLDGAPAAAPPAGAVQPAPTLLPGNTDTLKRGPKGGKLLANFSDGNAGAQGLNRGIDIAGNIGDPVLAAAPGKVIFVGVYPKHGNLVVLLHAEGFSTVYAHNQRVLVKEGQVVKRGQRIADLGNSDADQPKLHFELRQQGKPLDPLRYLPAR